MASVKFIYMYNAKFGKRRYMKKKFLLTFVGAATIVAPFASIIACSKNDTLDFNTKWAPTEVTVINKVQSDIIDALDKTPYSTQSLYEEANQIGNDAIWRRGITNEALVQSLSLVHAFAVYNGWDQTNYLKDNGMVAIGNDNNVSDYSKSDSSDDTKHFVEGFQSLKSKTDQINDADFRNSTMVFNYDDFGWQTTRMRVDWDDKLLSHDDLTATKASTRLWSWLDYQNPGTRVDDFVHAPSYSLSGSDDGGVNKIVLNKDAGQIYPIIKSGDANLFKPYIEAAIFKFIMILKENIGLLSNPLIGAGLPQEQLAMLDFIANKFLARASDETGISEILIPENVLDGFWNAVNNGSHNLQAVKVFVIGLGNSFANGDYLKVMMNEKIAVNSTLDGILAMDLSMSSLFGVIQWAAEGFDSGTSGCWSFKADKTITENIHDVLGRDTI